MLMWSDGSVCWGLSRLITRRRTHLLPHLLHVTPTPPHPLLCTWSWSATPQNECLSDWCEQMLIYDFVVQYRFCLRLRWPVRTNSPTRLPRILPEAGVSGCIA